MIEMFYSNHLEDDPLKPKHAHYNTTKYSRRPIASVLSARMLIAGMFSVILTTLFLAGSLTALPLNSPLLPSYDYISALPLPDPENSLTLTVVGGGPAGLTVANRLSSDANINVLVLEAGPADVNEPEIAIPAFIGTTIGGRYDWNLSTVPQIYLDGVSRNIPQGRVLGGGTVLNGMLWNRGGQRDYADWVTLGNPGWSWDDMLPYFQRSERYTPVYSAEVGAEFGIQEAPAVHGYNGPVNVSFAKYFWESSAVLFDALNELGVPTAYDPNTGLLAGASFLPMDVDPTTEERCTARRAYYDPIEERSNLWISTEQTVTQILCEGRSSNAMASQPIPGDTSNGEGGHPGMPTGIFGGTTTLWFADDIEDAATTGFFYRAWRGLRRRLFKRQSAAGPPPSPSGLVATGVEYAANAGAPRQTVTATREVIIAAGALHSPQLLMLSGIGPAAALQGLGITVNADVPGVGSNLQDHGQVWCWYPFYNASYPNPTMLTRHETFAAEAWDDYWTYHTGPLTSGAIDGVAFPSLPYIVNGSTLIAETAAYQSPQQYLPQDVSPTVLAGYTLQQQLLVTALLDVTRAAYEIINANDGVLTVANMRPFSRGTLTLRSGEPFDPPIIDPRYGSNPVDFEVLHAAMDFNQRLMYTRSLSQMSPSQRFPPTGASEEEILGYIHGRWQTEYHPAGTCAMMPLELGGVVGPDLLVYGTRNLRVVDSSIMPMLPAAHLQAVVYGVAEKAADIIRGAYLNNTRGAGSNDAPMASSSSAPSSSARSFEQASPAASPSVTTAGFPVMTTFVTVVYTQTVYA